jgi:hypothetical protein
MAERTQDKASHEKISLDDRTLLLFEGNMRRIFALKISHSTFRELQNVILSCANQDKTLANFLFETLLTGQIKEGVGNEKQRELLEEVIKNFTIPARLAKEITERGDFVSIITSDLAVQNEQTAFLHRIRRIDGEEFTFMADSQNTIHLLQHFVGRLYELEKHPKGKEQLSKYKNELFLIADKLKHL